MKRKIEPYYVINWDFNRDELEYYDIMPYLIRRYKAVKASRRKDNVIPKTFDEIKEFIISESQYQFWSRCEYEVIVHSWPPRKNDHKLDIFEQIEMNIDVITNHFMKHL